MRRALYFSIALFVILDVVTSGFVIQKIYFDNEPSDRCIYWSVWTKYWSSAL